MYVFGTTQSWVKQQRKTFVVFNTFVPYNPATDIPFRAHKKNFWHTQQVIIQRVTTRPIESGLPPPPVLETGDVFSGHDTFGWPEPPPPWWQAQTGFYVNFQTSFVYDPATDAPRFAKRIPWFGQYQEYVKTQWDPQLWELEGLTLVTVPDVTTEDLAAALNDLAFVSLLGVVSGSVYDPVIPIGSVVAQNPVGGQLANIGSTVMLILSLGPQPPPAFVGITLPDAIFIAVNADLIVGQPIVWQYDPVVPYNYVISQDPPAGSVVQPMAVVHFVASLGPAPVTDQPTVPNVVGLMILDAQNAISSAGCNPTNVVWVYSDVVPCDYVVSQSIAPGTIVPQGTQVVLTVSCGSPVTLPSGAQIVIPVMH